MKTAVGASLQPIVDVAPQLCAQATVAGPTVVPPIPQRHAAARRIAPPIPQQRVVAPPMVPPIPQQRTVARRMAAVVDQRVADRMAAANVNSPSQSLHLAATETRSGGTYQFRRFPIFAQFRLL
ncbi:MAG: hypothetical protein WCC78_03770 [Terriglobales bacterium]